MGCNEGERARRKTHRFSANRKTEEKLSGNYEKLFEWNFQGEDFEQNRNEAPSCEKNVGTDKPKLRI